MNKKSRKIIMLYFGFAVFVACGGTIPDPGEDSDQADASMPLESRDAGIGASSDSGTHVTYDGAAHDSSGYNSSYDSGSYDGGSYNSGSYDASYSDAASTYAPNDAGSSASLDASAEGIEPPVEEDWAWFQLSPDDSTSMATAQLLKVEDSIYWGFRLLPHEVINYYDPPASLREEQGPALQWTTPEGYTVALEALEQGPVTGDGPYPEAVDAGVNDSVESGNVDGNTVEWGDCGPIYEAFDSGDYSDACVTDSGPENDDPPIEQEQPVIREGVEFMVHVYAPKTPDAQRRPWNLHLCVDVSGSMSGEKIAFVQDALLRLVDSMQDEDQLSLSTFESSGQVLFASLNVDDNRTFIRQTIRDLEAGGGTNMAAGLTLAYGAAQSAFDSEMINRVLLFSDGDANVGDTDIDHFASLTRINNQEGIYLSGIGVGSGYAWETMNALTDAGKGAHVFLPDADEVGTVFGPMLHKLIEVAADDISIELSLPPGFALDSFSGEEVSTNPNRRVPNVVLASGDDMTLLASFSTVDPSEFDQDMILTLRYRPLSSAEPVVWEQRLAISTLFAQSSSALMQRTALVDRYARWAVGESFDDPALLEIALRDFSPSDSGLLEMADLVPLIAARRAW